MITWSYQEQSLQVRTDLLLLEQAPAHVNLDDLPHIAAGLTIHQKECEPAGFSYHRYCRVKSGLFEEVVEVEETGVDAEDEDAKLRDAWIQEHGSENAHTKENPNHYEILEIGHIGFNASEAQIKRAYQKMLLKYHPDKVMGSGDSNSDDGEEDPRFLAVQTAWEVLGDPKRRKGYDSTFDFDEQIPSGVEEFDDLITFYNLYGPVFDRNARFSEKKPVPLLGSEDTAIEEVMKFYSFWNKFDSWREFSKFDEHSPDDIETAESREEKRWMMRQNENQRAKKKKKEYERIRNLVERAQKRDPRLLAYYKAQQDAKVEARRKKIEAKLAAEEAARKEKEEAEAAKKTEEEARKKTEADARKIRQNAKKAHKKACKRLDKLVEIAYKVLQVSLNVREELDGELHMLGEDVEATKLVKEATTFFTGIDSDEVDEDAKKEIATAGADAIRRARQALKDGLTSMLSEEEQVKVEEARAAAKAAAIAKAAEEASNPVPAAEKADPKEPEWTPKELALLTKGVNKFPGGTRNRWEQIASYLSSNYKEGEVNIRTKEQCIAKSKSLGADNADRHKFQAQHARSEPDSPPTPTGESWSQEQQAQLESALKEFPASMDKNERWTAIANAVTGKSKKECAARFKFLRESVLSKQQNAK